jgi:hypothetical protein
MPALDCGFQRTSKVIDTAKPYFYMTRLVRNRLRDRKTLQRLGTSFYGNKLFLPHPFGLGNPAVWFDPNKRYFQIETSLPKLFQGHNVGGVDKLEYLCLQTAELVYRKLGLEFTPQERELVRRKRIRLGRLDTTCGFSMPTPHAVSDALEALWEQLRAEGFNCSAYCGGNRFESVYSQQRSTRVTDKFYDKGRELLARGTPTNSVVLVRIWEYARTLLRFEVTWRAKELKDLGLEYADQWTPQLIRHMVMRRLKMFDFQGSIRGCVPARQIDDLTISCRMFYRLWTQGANLCAYRHNRTLDRARTRLLHEHRVDIYRPARTGNDIPLRELITEENAYFVAPKWLVRSGAIYGVGKTSH